MPFGGKILRNANFLTICDIISSHSHTPYLAAFSSVILAALNTSFWKISSYNHFFAFKAFLLTLPKPHLSYFAMCPISK